MAALSPDDIADRDVDRAKEEAAKSLDLSFRQISRLPAGLSSFSSLEVLDLRSNQISEYISPEEAPRAKASSSGDAAIVALAAPLLPPGLRTLHLSSNNAEELGESLLLHLPALEHLDVNANRLRALPPYLLTCTALKELELERNQLTALPRGLGECLPLLRHLDVSYNSLRTLPESLGQLQHLEFLSARFNQLESVPLSLGKATALRSLDLSSNFVNLSSVPGTLGNLTNLTFLDLGNNHISVLPVQLGRLTALELLGLEGNPLTFPPLELLSIEDPREDTGVSTEAAEKARVRASTKLVKAFLAAKLQEWNEASSKGGGSGGTWETWLHDWPMLEWLASFFAGATPTPLLEGASFTVAPSARLPAPDPGKEGITDAQQARGISLNTQLKARLGATATETQALAPETKNSSLDSGIETLPTSSVTSPHIAVPVVRESFNKEACLA